MREKPGTGEGAAIARSRVARALRRCGIAVLAIVVAYGALLVHPQIVFAYTTRAGNLVLHARGPLPPGATEIAEAARERVARSPLYDPGRDYDVFLCDTQACFTFFVLWDRRVGGVSHVHLTGNAFIRPSRIERDRLIAYSGKEPDGDRTLTYFVAHEVAHTMTAAKVGRFGYHGLAAWQREGYADYVGKGGAGVIDYDGWRAAFKAEDADMDPRRSGLYRRYHLMVAFLLDHRGWTVPELLAAPIAPTAVEDELRAAR